MLHTSANKTSNARLYEERSRNQCGRRKAISIQYSQCASVWLPATLHAKCMRRIILSSGACLALQNLSTLSHKGH